MNIVTHVILSIGSIVDQLFVINDQLFIWYVFFLVLLIIDLETVSFWTCD